MYFGYEIVIYYQATVRLSQLLSNSHLRHISALCVSARPCGTHVEENSFPLIYIIKLMTTKLYKIHYYGSENVVSSSDEHRVKLMKVNIFSLSFLIGQTNFLMTSNIKKCRILYWLLYSSKINRKVKYSDLGHAKTLGVLLLTLIQSSASRN